MIDLSVNDKGICLVKQSESFRSRPYLCPAGKATIGYGSTFYEDHKPVRLSDPPITEVRATELLMFVLSEFEADVKKLLKKPINTNQFSALVSFVYNIGTEKFRNSTLLKLVNANPDNSQIREQFLRWKYGTVNGVMVVLPGLLKRRYNEANLYFEKP